jgi:hypothetical protein
VYIFLIKQGTHFWLAGFPIPILVPVAAPGRARAAAAGRAGLWLAPAASQQHRRSAQRRQATVNAAAPLPVHVVLPESTLA